MERVKNVEEFTVRDVIPTQYQNREMEDIVRPGVLAEPADVTSGRYNGNNIDGNARFRSRPTLGTGTPAGRTRTTQVRPPQIMPAGYDRNGNLQGLAGLGNFITDNPMRALLIAGAAVGVWWFCKKRGGIGSKASKADYAAII